ETLSRRATPSARNETSSNASGSALSSTDTTQRALDGFDAHAHQPRARDQHEPEPERERNVAAAGLEHDRGGHHAGHVRDVAADEEHGADLGEDAAGGREEGRAERPASFHEQQIG